MTLTVTELEMHYVQTALRLAANVTRGLAADHPNEAKDLLLDAEEFARLERRAAAAIEGKQE